MTIDNLEQLTQPVDINDLNAKYKYEFEGKGYKNKQTLHCAMVSYYLNETGLEKLVKVLEEAHRKVDALYPEDGVNNYKKVYLGFRDSNANIIEHDLKAMSASLTGKGRIDVVAYIFGAGGQPYVQSSELLYRYDFNEQGDAIIGSKLENGETNEGAEPNTSHEGKLQIGNSIVQATISTDPLA